MRIKVIDVRGNVSYIRGPFKDRAHAQRVLDWVLIGSCSHAWIEED